MSWRTQSHYRGLGEQDQDWLRDFDRQWDAKGEGRSRTDAMDRLAVSADDPSLTQKARIDTPMLRLVGATDKVALEAELIAIASNVARFTVPKPKQAGWSIHIVMKCGKRVRAHFLDWGSAVQAYRALEELSLWFPDP